MHTHCTHIEILFDIVYHSNSIHSNEKTKKQIQHQQQNNVCSAKTKIISHTLHIVKLNKKEDGTLAIDFWIQ